MVKVSVVIPTYNRADVLPRAIESILSQTYSNYEIVIVDDGSTDKTEELVQSYDLEVIKYIKHNSNKGQNVARNTGIVNSQGKYISYLDSDDIFLKEHLEIVVKTLDNLPEKYGGVYTAREDVLGDERVINEVHEGELTLDKLFSSGNAYEHIAGSISLTFRTEIIDDVGLHDEEIIKCTDLDFFIEILKKYKLYGINKPLCRVFKQQNSVSINTENIIEGEKRILNKHGHLFNNPTKAKRMYNIGIAYALEQNISEARRYLLQSIQANPYRAASYYHLLLCLLGNYAFQRFNKTAFF